MACSTEHGEQRMAERVDAVVVGAGPNGLAAALVLAESGRQVVVVEAAPTVGGGSRTAELTLPGFQHDVCSAVHPMAVASPFFRAFDLSAHGVEMLQPEAAYAHPLDGARAGIAWRDLNRTAAELGEDGQAWRGLLGPLALHWEQLADLLLSDFRSIPRNLVTPLRLLRRVVEQGSPAWNLRFRSDVAPALLTGVAAHAIAPVPGLAPAGAGLWLASLGHAVGWPIPRGGSQRIVDAVANRIRQLGGEIRTGEQVTALSQLPNANCVLLDLTPRGLLGIAGEQLPSAYRGWLERFRYGNAVCKVDFALSDSVPWAAEGCRSAGTVHVGGSRGDIAASEQQVRDGLHPERPYVLVSQPGVVDDTRAPRGQQTLWTYAHVPRGSTVDMGDAVAAQLERFAPGFRDVVLQRSVVTAAQHEAYNANYVGGDISAGATTPWQLVMRPAPRWDPYRTPIDGVYLCSSSTPPGPAVHGMAGVHAAGRALRQVFGDSRRPLDLVASGR